MKKYELMYILNPSLDEAQLKSVKEALHKILTDNGAKLGKIQEWGLRQLAYEIKKFKQGYYVVVEFETETNKAVSTFNATVPLNANVVRFLITKVED